MSETNTTRARPLADVVREFERDYVMSVLRDSGGKRVLAAAALGISRKTLWEKLRSYKRGAPQPYPLLRGGGGEADGAR